MKIKIGDEELTFQPDDVLDGPTGERVFRIIKTGHKFDVKKDLGAAAHLILVRNENPAAIVEMLFLAEGVSEKLNLSKTVTNNRHAMLAEIMAADEQPFA